MIRQGKGGRENGRWEMKNKGGKGDKGRGVKIGVEEGRSDRKEEEKQIENKK